MGRRLHDLLIIVMRMHVIDLRLCRRAEGPNKFGNYQKESRNSCPDLSSNIFLRARLPFEHIKNSGGCEFRLNRH